jgi:pimeloyl-ACP methyl ester carboxylesterase
MPFAPYKNYQVEYSVFGQGKGLVLVHGTGQSAENTWFEAAKHFVSDRKVVCPNYAGSGKTKLREEDLTVALLAEQVLAAADHAGLESFDIAGHSLGTCIAIYLAANYPGRIDKVVLLAGFLSTEDARSQLQFRMWKELAEINPKLLAKLWLFTAFSPTFVAGMTDDLVRQTVDAIFTTTNWEGAIRQTDLDLRVNVAKEANAMKQTALVIGCAHDYIVPISHSRALMKVLSNAQYAELAAGHGGCVENLDQFVKIVKQFLRL